MIDPKDVAEFVPSPSISKLACFKAQHGSVQLYLHCSNAALQLMEKKAVAVVGPQSSGIGHVISHVVTELHVPLLSFAAIADLVEHLGWREVTAIFVDDDYGRGGVIALGDALAKKRSRISYKAGFPPDRDR
ncbi:hypothetical protein BHM03_00035487 [Ensete ventricosum]|nr:hypothetical protein BHM03_00035487 [Ensete ventricosum]